MRAIEDGARGVFSSTWKLSGQLMRSLLCVFCCLNWKRIFGGFSENCGFVKIFLCLRSLLSIWVLQKSFCWAGWENFPSFFLGCCKNVSAVNFCLVKIFSKKLEKPSPIPKWVIFTYLKFPLFLESCVLGFSGCRFSSLTRHSNVNLFCGCGEGEARRGRDKEATEKFTENFQFCGWSFSLGKHTKHRESQSIGAKIFHYLTFNSTRWLKLSN